MLRGSWILGLFPYERAARIQDPSSRFYIRSPSPPLGPAQNPKSGVEVSRKKYRVDPSRSAPSVWCVRWLLGRSGHRACSQSGNHVICLFFCLRPRWQQAWQLAARVQGAAERARCCSPTPGTPGGGGGSLLRRPENFYERLASCTGDRHRRDHSLSRCSQQCLARIFR